MLRFYSPGKSKIVCQISGWWWRLSCTSIAKWLFNKFCLIQWDNEEWRGRDSLFASFSTYCVIFFKILFIWFCGFRWQECFNQSLIHWLKAYVLIQRIVELQRQLQLTLGCMRIGLLQNYGHSLQIFFLVLPLILLC